jgi:hypothetical protein
MVEAPIFEALSNFAMFNTVKRKCWKQHGIERVSGSST